MVYISIRRVFIEKKLKISEAKNALIGIAVVIIIFSFLQFFSSYHSIINKLDNPLANGIFVPSSMYSEIINRSIIIYVIQSIGILLAIPFANIWIKNRCEDDMDSNSVNN